MNTLNFEVLKTIYLNKIYNQRKLSQLTNYSLGMINKSIKLLKDNNYIDKNLQSTPKTELLVAENKPKSAIILAAGYGTRMIPICRDIPKGLLEINGEILIERIIRQLHEVGITEIFVVVGYMKEKFEYLIDKFCVNLVINRDYYEKNNLHSLSLVADIINNTYIVPCDIWCKNNPFSTVELYSWYLLSDEIDHSSKIRANRNNEIIITSEKELGNKEIGIAYIGYSQANILRNNILAIQNSDRYNSDFWEKATLVNKKSILYAKIVKNNDIIEINTYEDLIKNDINSKSLESKYIDIICSSLKVNREQIYSIESLKIGMTNRSFLFKCAEHKYIFRIPGEGTDKLVDRQKEYNVYQKIKNKGICDKLIYINQENGYKITEYIENSRNCDPFNEFDVRKCMKVLKRFHNMSFSVEHYFDIFEQIEYYEKLRNCKSMYQDYENTKKNIFSLKEYIDKQDKSFVLTHIDAVPDNFIITENHIYLIDWEYAAMQDPHVDIAMFAIYSLYDRKHIETLIDIYFDNNCSRSDRLKIYCYIAACGLLWSNWCEYKSVLGVDFGEYSLLQYRYAKDYYHIFMEEINNEQG